MKGSDPNPNPNRLKGREIVWKLALTILVTLTDPRRGILTLTDPWCEVLTLTLTLTESLGRKFFGKVALTCIPDPNRSTAINFVDVNGRSLYAVDWRMKVVVVEGGMSYTMWVPGSQLGLKCLGGLTTRSTTLLPALSIILRPRLRWPLTPST